MIPDQIIGAFQLFNSLRKLNDDQTSFPTITVTFDYKNIHDTPLSMKFRIALIHKRDYPNFSLFEIRHAPVS